VSILTLHPAIVSATCITCLSTYDALEHAAHLVWLSYANQMKADAGLEFDEEKNRGYAQVSHQEAITAAIEKTSEAHMMSFAGTLKTHAVTQAIADNNVDFSALAQSSYACCIETECNNINNGNPTRDGSYQNFYNSAYNYYTFGTSKHMSNKMLTNSLSAASGGGKVKATNVFPDDDNIVPGDINQVLENTILVINPNPFPALTNPHHRNTPSGQAYRALKKIKNTQLAVPQLALSEIVANKKSNYMMQDWVDQMAKSIGAGPTHPNIEMGLMSADGILGLQTEARYANPNWVLDFHRKPIAGLLRELAMMEAVNLEFERRILQSAEKEVFMAATSSSQKTNMLLNPQIEEAYTLAISQVQGNVEAIAGNEK